MRHPLVTPFLRWSLARGALARGWWLLAALHLVSGARLSATQLVLVGVFQGVVVVVAEVPAGVLADATSRRAMLVVAHIVTGTGMALTGAATSFLPVVVSQCLWGLGWAVASGADVAWITDELDDVTAIDRVLAGQARAEQLGSIAGIAAFGALGWIVGLRIAIVVGGVAMIALAGIVLRWPERNHAGTRRPAMRSTTRTIVRDGLLLARHDRTVLAVLAATFFLNGALEGFGRLAERRLLALGLPAHLSPIVWFALVALTAGAIGATVLRVVESRITGAEVAHRLYGATCAAGAAGLVVFAHAPNAATAVAGALVVRGLTMPATRVGATVIVNRRTPSATRATAHSMLSQAENAGEIVCGLTLAAISAVGSATLALTASAALLLCAAGAVRAAGGAARATYSPHRSVDDG